MTNTLTTKNIGGLYVVSTPIGNLEDITFRAVNVLSNVDLIAAESVTHSKRLCRHYNIDTKLIAYNQHNHKTQINSILKKLKSGADIALISCAGTPAISDPGSLLINEVLKNNIKVITVPGPSAVIAALTVSGLKIDKFVFQGFLPNKQGKRQNELKKLINESRTMVFYEAPHRVKIMLEDIHEVLGDRFIVIVRELTKIYEEIIRGPLSRVLNDLPEKIKGEFTIILEGTKLKKNDLIINDTVQKKINDLIKKNKLGVKEIAMKLSGEFNLPYRFIYKKCLEKKRAI